MRKKETQISKKSQTSQIHRNNPLQPCIFFLLPTWAEKPVLMAVTDRLDPHELHVIKYRRFSPLLSSVSGDLHVLQTTYSTFLLATNKLTIE